MGFRSAASFLISLTVRKELIQCRMITSASRTFSCLEISVPSTSLAIAPSAHNRFHTFFAFDINAAN